MFCQLNRGCVSVTAKPLELPSRWESGAAPRNEMSILLYWVNAVALTVGRTCASPCGKFSRPASRVAINLQKVGGAHGGSAQGNDQRQGETKLWHSRRGLDRVAARIRSAPAA